MRRTSSRLVRRLATCEIAAAVLACSVSALAVQPQQSAVRSTCRSLLTDSEVVAAMGRPATSFHAEQSDPGNSRCRWTWDDTGTMLTVSVSDAGAIAANAAVTPESESVSPATPNAAVTKCCPRSSAPMVPQFFDHAVRVEVELGTELPATLTEFQQRAVIFFDTSYLKIIVQLPDGLGQLVGVKVSREQIVALAHALVAP